MKKLSVPKRDNIHFTTQKADSYDKQDNFFITTRGMGKSDALWGKVYRKWKNEHKPGINVRTIQADLTESYFDDIETILNKFRPIDDYCTIDYKKGSIKSGVVDVLIKDNNKMEFELLTRVVALGIPVTRFKSLMIRNPSGIYYDEFIPNTRIGEKWLPKCAWRLKELYSTFARECDGYVLKRYFFGNPYTRFNPYLFEYHRVDTLKMMPGDFLVGDDYVVDLQKPKEELRDLLKKQNPDLLNSIDKEWQDFASGEFVNDSNYIIDPVQPQGFSLRWIFRLQGHNIGCFRAGDDFYLNDVGATWYVKLLDDYDGSKKIYAADFDNLIDGSKLIMSNDKIKLQILKQSIATRNVIFADTNAAFMVEMLYQLL